MATGVYQVDTIYKIKNYKEIRGGARSTNFGVKGGTVDFCTSETEPSDLNDIICLDDDKNLKGGILEDFFEYIVFKTNSGTITEFTLNGFNLEEV